MTIREMQYRRGTPMSRLGDHLGLIASFNEQAPRGAWNRTQARPGSPWQSIPGSSTARTPRRRARRAAPTVRRLQGLAGAGAAEAGWLRPGELTGHQENGGQGEHGPGVLGPGFVVPCVSPDADASRRWVGRAARYRLRTSPFPRGRHAVFPALRRATSGVAHDRSRRKRGGRLRDSAGTGRSEGRSGRAAR